MSKALINQYYNNLDRAIQFGKSTNETAIRNHFWILLNDYARKQNYEVVTEVWCQGTKGKKVKPDGIVKNLFGLDIGLWESKDEKTNIDDEINLKIKTGYPLTNILFEDSNTVILYQRGEEVLRIPMRDADKLHNLITTFTSFKNETVYKFEIALDNFKADIPKIVEALRERIETTGKTNAVFIQARDKFLTLCKAEINPEITLADVREMMIQHILTSDIFNRIFNDPDFHRHNTIARELENLIETLFDYSQRRNLLGDIEHYYTAISAAASEVVDHHEKQKFLKVLYENFYKVYNPKAADRLGVVYTPNEIVQFMVESTDYLLHKHFGKTLADENVDILDPATGTGTFITTIIDHIPKHLLAHKYKNELHANEVAILPYYIANLNVEFTFKQKMGYYEEYKNLCFVDTLDNVDALSHAGKQHKLFGLSNENSDRIKNQNSKKISVVIGNPPYNANQANFNDSNKNRIYVDIDKRIKETYVKYSRAINKANLYDMYTRFYRWTMDRVDKNGIIAFITNNSYINNKAFDGFRKVIQDEFDFAYIIDLGGNIRELSGKDGIWLNEENTIFGVAAAVGISIMFLVKKEIKEKAVCQISYIHPCDIRATRLEKLEYLKSRSVEMMPFDRIKPDKNNNWINIAESDFSNLVPLINRELKSGKEGLAIFQLYSLGIASHRDGWVYDFNRNSLIKKLTFFSSIYSKTVLDHKFSHKNEISWDRELDNYRKRGINKEFKVTDIRKALFRPFTTKLHYFDRHFNGMFYQWANITRTEKDNIIISVNKEGNTKGLFCIVTNKIVDLHSTGDSQCLPFFYYNKLGERVVNITDWALNIFQNHYKPKAVTENELSAMSDSELAAFTGNKVITKEDIFHYAYGVLHNPAYRKKYELDLKREFPRLPLYDDFFQWAAWGKLLMDLHINYETVEPYALKQIDIKEEIKTVKQKGMFNTPTEPEPLFTKKLKLKVKLKADKPAGTIDLDEQTTLTGIPPQAWAYKLGNRSALEWILDQYKEKKPSDPTIAEKFNTYRFADYKEQVIDLLKRVCTVSVKTMHIIAEMEQISEKQ